MDMCPCGSKQSFQSCCQPLLLKNNKAKTPEQLMRSRFSAFATKHYDYILSTYIGVDKGDSHAEDMAKDYEDIHWLHLDVKSSGTMAGNEQKGFVHFCAYFGLSGKLYALSEESQFQFVNDEWFYLADQSDSHNERVKLSRNDSCICQSGKKFKKCCALKIG